MAKKWYVYIDPFSKRFAQSVFCSSVRVEGGKKEVFLVHGYDEVFGPSVFSNSLRQSCNDNDNGDADGTFASILPPSAIYVRDSRHTPPLFICGAPQAGAVTLAYPI